MPVTINGTTGISSDTGYSGDGVSFADGTPANTLVTTTGGNVGIGTSSPQSLLDLTGNDPTLRFTDNAGSPAATFSIRSADAAFRVRDVTNGSDRLIIDASGNLGIGTSSPGTRLHVAAANPTRGVIGRVVNTSTTSQTGAQIQFTQAAIADWAIGQPAGADAFAIWSGRDAGGADGTERARIDSSGNLLVGTTSSSANTRLTVAAPQRVGYFFTSNAANGQDLINIGNSTGGYSFNAFRFWNGALDSGSIVGSVSCTTTATSYNTSSDYRLKKDISPMTGALSRVAALKPVTYKWKSDGSDGEGFIAHELAEVCPQAVTGKKDEVETVEVKDDDGNVIGTEQRPVYQGIDTSFLVATLTAAIQELNAKVDAQAAEIAALKGIKQ